MQMFRKSYKTAVTFVTAVTLLKIKDLTRLQVLKQSCNLVTRIFSGYKVTKYK